MFFSSESLNYLKKSLSDLLFLQKRTGEMQIRSITKLLPFMVRGISTNRVLPSVAIRLSSLVTKMNSVTSVPHVRYFATKCNSGNKQCQSNCHECERIQCSQRLQCVDLTQCWNCHEFNDCNERFCHHCHKIQPVVELTDSSCNYYKMFSLYVSIGVQS